MAEVLNEWPGRANGGSYPWNEWTDGRVYRATAGEDFKVPTNSFAGGLYSKARSMKCKVRVSTVGGNVTFQFLHGEVDDQ